MKVEKQTLERKPGEIRSCVFKKGFKCPQVSSKGRFRSASGVLTYPKAASNGYVSINIMGSTYRFHVLSCRAFHGPAPSVNHTVDHIDNNPSNNNIENLRWATPSQQIKHSYATNLTRESNATRLSKPVKARKLGEDAWVLYDSAHDAARKLGLDSGNVSAVCRGKRRKTGGYEFCFAPQNETLPGEKWRNVVPGDGPYEVRNLTLKAGHVNPQVSSLGRFRSTRNVVTRPKPQTNGYVKVQILGSLYFLHSLICRAFHGPAESANHTTDHIDNNPSNNNMENLRWATRSQQIKHSYATNLEREGSAPRRSKPVRARKVGESTWISYDSARAAARALKLHSGSIAAVCQGKRRKTSDYEFCYPEEEKGIDGEEWRDVVMQS